jgi:protein TonB
LSLHHDVFQALNSPIMKRLTRVPLIFLIAIVFNAALFFIVPFLQAAFHAPTVEKKAEDSLVQRDVYVPLPDPAKPPQREIKEIRLQPVAQPVAESRPTLPGGGLKIDLSPAGSEGAMALVSGGDRTGPLGSGTGGGTGAGSGNMVYEPGQTDSDARISGPDQPPRYPPRAEREGVTGYVDLLFVVNESGFATQITVLKEDPQGYGFAAAAIEAVRKLRFQPAMLQRIPVKQKVRRRVNFEL